MPYLTSTSWFHHARRTGYYAIACLAFLVPVQSRAEAASTIITADPNRYPSPTADHSASQDISNVFPGVTLSAFSKIPYVDSPTNAMQLLDSKVYSKFYDVDSSGKDIYVYGAHVNNPEIGSGNHVTAAWTTTDNLRGQGPDRNFRADFNPPVSYAFMDVIADNGDTYVIDAYNSNGESVGTYTVGGIYDYDAKGKVLAVKYPVKFSRTNADIKYLVGQNPSGHYSQTVFLGNLQYSVAPVSKALGQDPNPDPYVPPVCKDVKLDAVTPVLKLDNIEAYAGSPLDFSVYACGGNGAWVFVPPKPLPKGLALVKPLNTLVFDKIRNELKADFAWTPTDKQSNKRYKVTFKAKENKKKGKSSPAKTLQIRVWPATDNPINRGVIKSPVTSAVWDCKKSELRISGKLKLSSLLTSAERKELLKGTNLVQITNESGVSLDSAKVSKSGAWKVKTTWSSGVSPGKVVADFLGKKDAPKAVKINNCKAK